MGENMKYLFYKALGVVLQFWLPILAVGLGDGLVTSGVRKNLAVHGARPALVIISILAMAITIIVFGRIIAHLVPGMPTDNWTIFRDNWLNYVMTAIIIGLPLFVFRLLIASRLSSLTAYIILVAGFSTVVGIVTIYVWPIVFLKKTHAASILAGISFLSINLAASAWIAGIVVLFHALNGVGMLAVSALSAPGAVVVAVSFGVVTSFLVFLSFTAAAQFLVEETSRKATSDV